MQCPSSIGKVKHMRKVMNDACDRVDCVARKYFHFQFDLP